MVFSEEENKAEENFYEKYLWRIAEWFPELDANKLEKLTIFHKELCEFSKGINLVSPKTLKFADVIHFADSISACKIVLANSSFKKIFDFGSGNGLPGLVLGILAPNIEVTLVDSDSKKIEFMKHVIDKTNATNVKTMLGRVESLPEGSVEFAICRGFMPLAKAIYNTRHIFAKGGVFYHLKGEEWGFEIASIPSQLCSVWAPHFVGDYKLPIGGVKFAVVKTEKI